jgi:uncharacterized membrane protein
LRRILEIVALAALVALIVTTGMVLAGPYRLPDRIPTHFDLAGRADGWGTPPMLLALPAVAVVLYLLITLVARFPGVFHYPVRVTAANRAQLEALALDMIVWLKAELMVLFGWIQAATIEAARSGHNRLSPWLVPAALAAIFLTIGWHFAAMMRAGKSRAGA